MKNKGFTLVELIAVLIILAIISLIVAPLILNTVRRVKNDTNKRSIDGYGRAAQYAISNYELKQLPYPDSFDELEIDYHGNKVECETSRINPDHTIYLSKCKVNGKLVKDDKNKDGYYHYGTLKMTNIEYVDTYGKNLEDALKKYHDEHNEYPSDYTTLALEELDKEVVCNIKVNCDGTFILSSCTVNNEEVSDYTYGLTPLATTCLLLKTNAKTINNYTDGNTHEMYTFDHGSTVQTSTLTDYRYIGNDPYNYVKFNGDETWRIIGVFDVDDGTGNYEKRIKLIRNDSLGNKKWDENIDNEWVDSTMQVYINDEYKLDPLSEMVVDNVNYYLGARKDAVANSEQFYVSERSNTTINSERNKNWNGRVGLIYPSDYYYTYSLGIDDTCYELPRKCTTNNNANPSYSWLYNELQQWTIMPSSSSVRYAFFITTSGAINTGANIANIMGTRPVVYLKPNVKIKSGDGSIDNPYEFEL